MSKKSYEEYKRERDARDKARRGERFEKILQKGGAIQDDDVYDFYSGLTMEQRDKACLLYLLSCYQSGDSPAEIVSALQRKD